MTHAPRHDTPAADLGPVGLTRDRFADAYRDAYRDLWLVAAAVANTRAAADDLVQEAAIIGMGKLRQAPHPPRFTPWMAAIVRNVSKNLGRSESRRRVRELAAGSTAHQITQPAHATQTSDRSATNTTLANEAVFLARLDPPIRAALAALTDQARACFLLRVVADRPYSQIAAILNLPEATARSNVFRARRTLLEMLDPSAPARTVPRSIGLDDLLEPPDDPSHARHAG